MATIDFHGEFFIPETASAPREFFTANVSAEVSVDAPIGFDSFVEKIKMFDIFDDSQLEWNGVTYYDIAQMLRTFSDYFVITDHDAGNHHVALTRINRIISYN